QVVDVEKPAPSEHVPDSESRDPQRIRLVFEDPDEPVALGALHTVDALDEVRLELVMRPQRPNGREGERGVRADDLAELSCHSGETGPGCRRARPTPGSRRRAPDALRGRPTR